MTSIKNTIPATKMSNRKHVAQVVDTCPSAFTILMPPSKQYQLKIMNPRPQSPDYYNPSAVDKDSN